MYKESIYNKHNFISYDLKGIREIFIYQDPTNSLKKDCNIKKNKKKEAVLTEQEIKERERQKEKYFRNKQKYIQRLIQSNISRNSYFITLTYAKKTTLNDLDKALKDFKYFITKLNNYYYKNNKRSIKYIATWEFKKDNLDIESSINNTRHLHFHIWIDFPNIKKVYNADIAKIWKHGFTNTKNIKLYTKENLDHIYNEKELKIKASYIGNYLGKYLTKDLSLKEDLKHRKSLLISRNLQKPIVDRRYLNLKTNPPKEVLRMLKDKENQIFKYERKLYNQNKKSSVIKLFITEEEFKKYNLNKIINNKKENYEKKTN